MTEQRIVQASFGDHHRRLERMFDEVLATVRVGDEREVRGQWSALDQELTEHLALEEQWLLPRLAEVDAAAVETLRAEHAVLRRELGELGADIDLHRVNEPAAAAFFDQLRAHAAREDALLYRWADTQLGEPERSSLIERLRQIARLTPPARVVGP